MKGITGLPLEDITPEVTTPVPFHGLDPVSQEEYLAHLVKLKIVPASKLIEAILRLDLSPVRLARALGYESIGEFYSQFTQAHDEELARAQRETPDERESWSIWTYPEMSQLYDLVALDGYTLKEASMIMQMDNPKRSYKSVQSFWRRTFSLGNLIDAWIWELFEEGYTAEELIEAGYPGQRAHFTESMYHFVRYCAKFPRKPQPRLTIRK